jgi:MFS transporter, DHA1 family, multidrug resistance protein
MRLFVQDSALAQLIRLLTTDKILQFPENEPGFTLPASFNRDTKELPSSEAATPTSIESQPNSTREVDLNAQNALHPALFHSSTRGTSGPEEDVRSREIQPTITEDGKLLVTWYSIDDPDNPQNWSSGKKLWVSFLIWYVILWC